MLLNCGIGEDSWESLGQQGDQTSSSSRKSVLYIHWKDWCWSWNSNTLATWCKELTHLKRPWCWERLKAGAEGGNRGWDGWMASPTQWTWIWVSSGSWWWTEKPGMLQSMGHKKLDITEWLNWTDLHKYNCIGLSLWIFHTIILRCESESVSCSVLFNSLQLHWLQPTRLLCHWTYPGKNTEWEVMPSSRASSWPRDQTWVPCLAGRFFTVWANREAPNCMVGVMLISNDFLVWPRFF